LKKRTKKRLLLGVVAPALPHRAMSRRFFAAFFSKKEVLAS
jgi:hypothetical protein